jgi:predicted TIM-barrel fold metal-dependent hydrolase
MAPHRIDTHHHPYPPAYVAKVDAQLRTTTHAHYKKLVSWTPAQVIEAMDRDGIAAAVLSISAPGVWVGKVDESRALGRLCNDACARIQADHKGRFGHFAALPLPDIEGSLYEIEHSLDTLKADGIALMTNYDDKWPGDPAFAPVFDELNRRGAVVYFHPVCASFLERAIPGVPPPTIEFPFDTTRAIASLMFSGTFTRCPNIKWIFSHGGGALPMLAMRMVGLAAARPDMAAKVPNGVLAELKKLYYDAVGVYTRGAFAALREIAPVSQILFGTDYPFWSTESAVNGIAALGLSAEEAAAIERGNALRLLPRLAGTA